MMVSPFFFGPSCFFFFFAVGSVIWLLESSIYNFFTISTKNQNHKMSCGDNDTQEQEQLMPREYLSIFYLTGESLTRW